MGNEIIGQREPPSVADRTQGQFPPPTLAQIKTAAAAAHNAIWQSIVHYALAPRAPSDPVSKVDRAVASALDAAYGAGQRDAQIPPLMKMDEHGNVTMADQAEKITELEAWKASAMAVMAPLEDIMKEFSLPLGSSITESVAEWVRELNSELNAAVDENAGLRAEIARLRNPAAEPVKHVASPSIGARWDGGPGVLPAQMVKP